MKSLTLISHPQVKEKFDAYPDHIRPKMLNLRRIILETAEETEGVKSLEETLKWGEPSYLVKKGSTIRLDWKAKTPEQYQLYFKCTSKLVPAFKLQFGDLFRFENTRAIIFGLDEDIPEGPLKKCIRAGLTYHKVKDLPILGMDQA